MPFIPIPSTDVDQGSVVDESLMLGKVKNNLDDLNARTVALEALSGGGGVAAAAAEDLFADIVAGGEDDVAKFWKVRHHVMMNTNGLGVNAEGQDLEERDVMERFFHDPNFTVVSAMVGNANGYLGTYFNIEQNEQLQFRIKKGENFFCISTYLQSVLATQWSVFVDGVNANTYGLVDENGTAVPATLSSNSATLLYGKIFHFYGLDGEEHVITIKNVNATALEVPVNFIDVGYRSEDYAIDHTIHIKAGAANVGGIAAAFNEGSYSFSRPGIGLANGYTGMLKVNQSGTVTAIDGLSPAKTEVKPQTAINFTAPVTSLPVKNHWYFPSSGICMFCHPSGENYFFSYSSKQQPGGPASQTLDGIIWQAQPTESFTARPDIASLAVNTFRGDGRIEYWAKPPIEISGTNNKVDFQITIDGVETSHTATIPSGFYAADIIRLGKAFEIAMKAAKPLPKGHRYFLEYNSRSQLWTIGAEGDRISKINFRWSTGANSGTSLGPVLGFSSDVIDATSYLSPLVKQHLARRVFVADENRRDSEHPSVKYAWDAGLNAPVAEADQILQVNSLSGYRRQDASGQRVFFNIYPDEDCCGLSLMFMREDIGTYIEYMVDDGDGIYLCTSARPIDSTAPTKGALIHSFISFPKGSRKITIKAEANLWFETESVTQFITFFGYRQYYTKPQWEMLSPQEKILKCIEVNPIRMFATNYGNNTALYSPQPTNDNINSLVESGTWVQTTLATIYNQRERQTVTAGGYLDVEFVLTGNGGGIGIRRFDTTDTTRRMAFYLASGGIGSIVEGTDLIEFESTDWFSAIYKRDFQHLGLPAGTYTLRMKNLDTQRMINNAVIVYDTVLPQPGARTLSEVSNTGQSVSYPINVRRRENSRYQSFRQPSYYVEGNYKRGIVHHGDFLAAAITILNRDESGDVIEESDTWWCAQNFTNTGDYTGYRTFCRSICSQPAFLSTYSTVVQPSLDGRNLNTISIQQEVKGGFAPSSTRYDSAVGVLNNLEYALTFDTGLTYLLPDTRGVKAGMKVLLTDGTSFEESYIASFVTDVSITLAKALTVLTDSAVNKVFIWGFHNLRMTSGDAVDWYHNAFVYEPLPLEESILPTRVQTEKREEVLFLNSSIAAVALVAATRVTARIPFPIHSDGEEGNFYTMQFYAGTVDAQGQDIAFNNPATLYLNIFLRAIISAAGAAISASTAQIVSRKFVKLNSDLRIRG
jgi:hypothetical protein